MRDKEFKTTLITVSEINRKLINKGLSNNDITAFWNKIFGLVRIINLVGIDSIKVCTGCGRLNIENTATFDGINCCSESNYKPIKD